MRAHTPENPPVTLPLALAAPALAAVLDDAAEPSDAGAWVGRFAYGWTSEELNTALPVLSAALGMELAVLWAYQDQWGFGGDSELVAITGDGLLAAPPEGAERFLVDGDLPLSAVARTAGPLRSPAIRAADAPACWGANLAAVHAPDRELG